MRGLQVRSLSKGQGRALLNMWWYFGFLWQMPKSIEQKRQERTYRREMLVYFLWKQYGVYWEENTRGLGSDLILDLMTIRIRECFWNQVW